ncbi:MAG TPA: hypothetical protein DC042_10905 [Bacteroidales bacterium]|nr:hypothetical protein [Bacteroidales bacterium]
MKKIARIGTLALWLLLTTTGGVLAQSFTAGDIITLQVQDFALIETNHAPVSLTLSTSVAGMPVSAVSNSDMFVKISSLVPGGTNREITARISSGSVPTGTTLTMVASPCTLINSGGRLGTVVSTPIVLGIADQFLVTGIGSCYTGTGYNDGFRLTYNWSPTNLTTDYHLLSASSSPVSLTIVLTITAHDGN